MAGERLWIERRKWRDIPHYAHEGWLLGEDEDGVWIGLRAGSPVHRGDDVLFYGKHDGLMLAPRGSEWLAWFPREERFDLYVDIVCDMTHTPESITMIDLDLDVVRYPDGRVELLDEDEFEEHQLRYGYPSDVVSAARHAGDEVLAAVRANEPPFDGEAAAYWRSVLG